MNENRGWPNPLSIEVFGSPIWGWLFLAALVAGIVWQIVYADYEEPCPDARDYDNCMSLYEEARYKGR
ncbi:MAG: hypothetical protein EXR43_00870 [Dehalococcoidia bacterium]|nr:hypothetical protein [Dehalococcoidia bacterium]